MLGFQIFYIVYQLCLYSLFFLTFSPQKQAFLPRFFRYLLFFTLLSGFQSLVPLWLPLKSLLMLVLIPLGLWKLFHLAPLPALQQTLSFAFLLWLSEGLAVLAVQETDFWLEALGDVTELPGLSSWQELIIKSLLCIFFSAMTVCLTTLRSKLDWWSKGKILLIESAMVTFQLGFFLTLYGSQMEAVNTQTILVCVVFCLLSGVIYGICCYDIQVSFSHQEQRLEQLYLSKEKAQVMYYYQLATQHAEETRQYRHDLSNQLQCLSALLQTDVPQAQLFLEQLEESVLLTTPIFSSGNAIVDTILTIKYHKASTLDIPMEIYADQVGSAVISDMDMCNLLCNVIDNAMDASLLLPKEQRNICLKLISKGEYIVLKCENSFNGKVKKRWGEMLSSKRNFVSKGYGLKILQEIAEKYHGSMLTSYEGTEFQVTVLLKILLKVERFGSPN